MRKVDMDYYSRLGWEGYYDDSDDVDTFEHTPKTKFAYSTHKRYKPTQSHRASDFDDTTKKYPAAHSIYGHTPYVYEPPVSTPTDTRDTTQLSIVFMRQDILNKISDHCSIVAKGTEFQVNYRSLIVKLRSADATVHLSFPTAYYTFKQDVAHSSVEYELTDMDNNAALVHEKSAELCGEYMRSMEIISALYDAGFEEVDVYEANSGSMHRHPGRFGFSSIDYRKNPKHPGVIYRQGSCKNFLQTDSVIYLDTQRTEVFTTESRIVNVERDGAGVKGTYCRIPTITYIYDAGRDIADVFTSVLGSTGSNIAGFERILCSMLSSQTPNYELLNHILESFSSMNVVPDTTFVNNKDISATTTYSYYSMGIGRSEVPSWGQKREAEKAATGAETLFATANKEAEKTNPTTTTTDTTTNTAGASTDVPRDTGLTQYKHIPGVDLSAWARYLKNK